MPRTAKVPDLDSMSMAELSELLNIPIHTIRRWRLGGYGPPGFRAGKAVRYRKSAVSRWIDEQEAADKSAQV